MDALRQIFAEFGIRWDSGPLAEGNRQVNNASAGLEQLAQAFAGATVLNAIRGFADGMAADASALQDASDTMGTTTADLQELEHAAVMAGLSTDGASRALAHFQQTSAQAATGGRAQASTFHALGISVRDASGNVRPLNDLMNDLPGAFGRITDPARRAQLAQELFGRSGARMVNVLHEGAGGLAEFRAEVAELGGGLFPEAVAAANDYDDAMDRNRLAMSSLRSVLAVELLPRLTELVTRGTHVSAWLVKMTRDTNFAKTALAVLGVVGAAAGARFLAGWLPTIVRFGGMALIIAGVALVLEDLISLANGGPSAIGDFVDSFAGLGTAQRLAQTLNEGWRGMIDYIGEIGTRAGYVFGEKVPASASKLVAPFVKAFDDIEGAWNAVWSRVGGPVATLVRALERAGHFLSGGGLREGLSDAVTARIAGDSAHAGANTVETRGHEVSSWVSQVARDVRDEYADIFNGHNQALAHAAPAVLPAGAARGGGNTVVHDNRQTNIPITGVTDPHTAAREAVRLLDARDRARRDADHHTRDTEG